MGSGCNGSIRNKVLSKMVQFGPFCQRCYCVIIHHKHAKEQRMQYDDGFFIGDNGVKIAEATAEHVIPICIGGKNTSENIIPYCRKCNGGNI